MSDLELSAQLRLNIENLFHGRSVAESNAFIQSFSETKECWIAAAMLLENDKTHIRYFSANIIFNKVNI
jgi:hypothetical protein